MSSDSEHALATLFIIEAAKNLSEADLPTEIADALAIGAMKALRTMAASEAS